MSAELLAEIARLRADVAEGIARLRGRDEAEQAAGEAHFAAWSRLLGAAEVGARVEVLAMGSRALVLWPVEPDLPSLRVQRRTRDGLMVTTFGETYLTALRAAMEE